MIDWYILDENNNPILTDMKGYSEWSRARGGKTHVRDNIIKKYNVRISTVFLSLDHNYLKWSHNTSISYRPLVFETMVFWEGHSMDQYMERYLTWNDALIGHRKIVKEVIQSIRDSLN